MVKRWCNIKEIEVYLLCEILISKDTLIYIHCQAKQIYSNTGLELLIIYSFIKAT